MRKAILYVDHKEVIAELLYTDDKTYIAPVLVFQLPDGRKIAVFENGDKFKKWV